MTDYAKIIAFPAAGVSGYLASVSAASSFTEVTGLSQTPSQLIVVASVALISGFLFDDVIPGYIRYVRNRNSSNNSDTLGGDSDTDINLD